MLKSLFNRAARPSYLPEKPIIMVSTIGDDDNRGDSHAYMGLARVVAEKLGGEYRHINDNTITAAYPTLQARDRALHEYFNDNGVPDILFSRFYHSPQLWYPVYTEKQDDLFITKCPHIITAMNESLTKKANGEDVLVSHHLTPSLLKAEGDKLLEAYPKIKDAPLITVMMADNTNYELAEALIPRLKDLPQSTLFICSGRRTDGNHFNELMNSMAHEIGKHGVQNRVRVMGYDFQKEIQRPNTLNPYMGLIAQSDHIVICGDSRSIVSEALSAQRSLYMYQGAYSNHIEEMYSPLLRDRIILPLNKRDAATPLATHPVCIRNPTEQTADRIIKDYKRNCRRQLGMVRGTLAYVMEG